MTFKEVLRESGITVELFSRATGTPKDTVYGWTCERTRAPGLAFFAVQALKSGYRPVELEG